LIKKRSIDLSLSNRQARKTTLIVAGALLLLAAWNFYRQRLVVVTILGGIALALILVGLLIPPAARAFHNAWMKFASILGYINSRVLLFLLFYLVITPYGLIAKLFGRDVLNRRAKSRESYWIPRENSRQTKEQFERSF
jgi:Saxitoxin biosynthesis operon protein SxtJ